MENINLKDLLLKYRNKELTERDVENLWYDWFCKESSLMRKGWDLLAKLNKICDSKKLNLETSYVFFKNNCPCNGTLYDDFRICDIETRNVIYTVAPRSGHSVDKGKGVIWGKENDFKEPLFKGSWREIRNWFNN